MQTAIELIGSGNNVLLSALTIVSLVLARRAATATGWLLGAAFGVFTVGTLTGYLPWAIGESEAHAWFAKGRLLLQITFPYLLLRLAHAFNPFHPVLLRVATVLVAAIATYIAVVPVNFADPALDVGAPLVAIGVLAYVGWTLGALAAVAWRFFAIGRGQPGTIRRRMQLLGVATLFMLVAYVTAFASWWGAAMWLMLFSMLAVGASAILFVLGVATTARLRTSWRRIEEHELRAAITDLMAAETRAGVLDAILPKARRIVGARAVALVHPDGTVERVDGMTPREADQLASALRSDRPEATTDVGPVVTVPFGDLRLAMSINALTPLLGAPELELLSWVGSVVDLALDRCAHLEADRAAVDRLREIDRLKSEFVQIVAHDLRSPMAAVAGLAGTLNERWDDIERPTRLEMLDHIEASTRRMAELVVDVLDIAQIESGELRYECQPFDLADLVERSGEEVAVREPSRRVRVTLPQADDRLAAADVRRTGQVIDNLLSNAVKYSPTGSPIDVRVERIDHDLRVQVTNEGAGIPPQLQGRIFEKFGRAVANDDTTPGSGLGLYICKAMVEAQGGRIWLDSTPGEGATFSFTVPMAGSAPTLSTHAEVRSESEPTRAPAHP